MYTFTHHIPHTSTPSHPHTLTPPHPHTPTLSQIKRPPEIQLTLVPQKSMGGGARNQRPLSIQLIAKYPTDYPDRFDVSIPWSPPVSLPFHTC